MKIEVHIKDKQFQINCGDGLQKVKWLGDVAIFRHSHFYTQINSTTKGIKLENGEMIDLNAIISSSLAENTHVWVVLKGNKFHSYQRIQKLWVKMANNNSKARDQ